MKTIKLNDLVIEYEERDAFENPHPIFQMAKQIDDMEEKLKTHALVPRVATHRMISAMATSSATDDEGEFPALMDLLDFSGENARHTVLRAAYRDVILAAEQETQDNEQ